MNVRAAILTLATFALCAPVAASADQAYTQGQWLYGNPQQQQFFSAIRTVVTDQGQRANIRTIVNQGYNSGQSDRQIDDAIMASLSNTQRQQVRQQLGWGGFNNGNRNLDGFNGYTGSGMAGIVSSVSKGAITFQNGRTAFLRDSTTYAPNRDAIVPGTRIVVEGDRTGNNINANTVSIYNGAGYNNSNGYNDGGLNSYGYTGVITNVSRGDITLGNGRTVFLKDDTTFNPNRDALQPGKEISVKGSFIQNGNLNATEVDIVNFNQGSYFNNGGWSDSYQNGSYLGVVQNVTKGAVTLRNGHTAFIHDGTTISQTLAVGQRIAIQGSPTANGNINADHIDVIGTAGFTGGPLDIFNGGERRFQL